MINISNIVRIESIPFDQYLQVEGYSHSFLKHQKYGVSETMEVTANMRTGSLVDGILTEPEKVNMADTLYRPAKEIAMHLKKTYGSMIDVFKKQVSYTATFEYNGFFMKTKGRLDFELPGKSVIDLKVTWSKDVRALIAYMGYDNQLYSYCKMAGVNKAYIMIYSVPLKKISIIEIDVTGSNLFWENAILDFGTVKSDLIHV